MKWIGLTGGISSGKTSVSRVLQELGYPVVDADKLAHQAIAKGSDGHAKVVSTFGQGALSPSGEIDRTKLGQLVFSAPEKLRQLEQMVHPEVRRLMAQERLELEAQDHVLAFYDVPLLFEKGLQDQFDATVMVYCTPEQQASRLSERNPELSAKAVDDRIQAQLAIDEKKEMADVVIDNSGAQVELKGQAQAALAELQALITKPKSSQS